VVYIEAKGVERGDDDPLDVPEMELDQEAW
jgi:hypothetical protein